MQDSLKHKGRRRQLVKLLMEKDIKDPAVLRAIENVPRHLFLDSSFEDHAYQNKAFPIGAGQTISHPYTVAFQTELLEVEPDDKILEIGTGCGYQTAVLLEMGAKVYSIERQNELFHTTKRLLPKMGYFTNLFYGDGYKGLPEYAPFDKIIVTAGAPFVPEALKEQLAIGGIMVIPVGVKEQKMYAMVKVAENQFETIEYHNFSFVPLLEDKAK